MSAGTPYYMSPGMIPQPQPYYQPASVPYTPAPPAPPPFMAQPVPQYRPQPWSPTPAQQIPVQMARAPMQATPPPMQQYQQAAAPWAPIHFQIPQALPFSPLGYYGYYPDQVWGALAAVPPVWRPQQPGESFASRAMKNFLLVLLEKAFEQGMFATRQMFLPPKPGPASEAVIDAHS